MRRTAFEKGFPIHYARSGAGWEPDAMIWDDQNVIRERLSLDFSLKVVIVEKPVG